MQWILGHGKGIEFTSQQLDARMNFIKSVTNADVSPWKPLFTNGLVLPFLTCVSNDGVSGLFITAHSNVVYSLCNLLYLTHTNIIVINSCLLIPEQWKQILEFLSKSNPRMELFFAKQETIYFNGPLLAKYVTISNVGEFGFRTSISERDMFRNRKLGIKDSIYVSFDKLY